MAKRDGRADGRGAPKRARAPAMPEAPGRSPARPRKSPSPAAVKAPDKPKSPPLKDGSAQAELQALFGTNLRAARIKCGMSRGELGKLSGLGPEYISKVEHGHKNLTIGTMTKLAEIVGEEVSRMLRRPK